MTKYLFVYHGGKMASNPQERQEAMNAWAPGSAASAPQSSTAAIRSASLTR